jgi:glycosyltransferase involved in cell wall biosynthesis
MNSDYVSVIIPVYNNVLYLGEAVESVLKQSFTNYEIIIVDDGSTEDIVGSIQQYLDVNENIRYVRQENKGPGPARNTGIRMAKGKWIAFLDADDIWMPEKLEKQIAFLREHPNTIVTGAMQGLDCRSGAPVLREDIRCFKHLPTKAATFTNLLKIPYLCAVCGLGSLIMSMDMLDDVGLFDESFHTVEDDDLIFRLFRKYPFDSIPDVVVLRRKHSSSMTTGSSLEPRIKNKYRVTKKILALIDDSEITTRKNEILGYWTEEFVRRYVYHKRYGYALKWLLIGLTVYPHYYTERIRKKALKILKQYKQCKVF